MASTMPWAGGYIDEYVDVKCIEKDPQRVRRIREPPVNERVCGEEITKLVVNFRLRDRHPWQQGKSQKNRCRADGSNCRSLVSRELREPLLEPPKEKFTQPRLRQSQREADRYSNPIQFIHEKFSVLVCPVIPKSWLQPQTIT